MKLKDDVPFINIVEMGYQRNQLHMPGGEPFGYYVKNYGHQKVIIDEQTRQIEVLTCGGYKFIPKKYDYCVKDLNLKQYLE